MHRKLMTLLSVVACAAAILACGGNYGSRPSTARSQGSFYSCRLADVQAGNYRTGASSFAPGDGVALIADGFEGCTVSVYVGNSTTGEDVLLESKYIPSGKVYCWTLENLPPASYLAVLDVTQASDRPTGTYGYIRWTVK